MLVLLLLYFTVIVSHLSESGRTCCFTLPLPSPNICSGHALIGSQSSRSGSVCSGLASSMAHLVQYLLFASVFLSTRNRLLTDNTNAKKKKKTSQCQLCFFIVLFLILHIKPITRTFNQIHSGDGWQFCFVHLQCSQEYKYRLLHRYFLSSSHRTYVDVGSHLAIGCSLCVF